MELCDDSARVVCHIDRLERAPDTELDDLATMMTSDQLKEEHVFTGINGGLKLWKGPRQMRELSEDTLVIENPLYEDSLVVPGDVLRYAGQKGGRAQVDQRISEIEEGTNGHRRELFIDKIINADKRAADFIRQRYEEDRNQEEMKERMKIMRTKEMREEFQRKQRFGSKVPKATKLTPCSERINQLARPKTSRDAYKEAGPLDGIDFKGLLVVDHTVGPLVRDRVRRNSIKNEAKGEKISRRGRRKSRDMPQEQDRIRTAPASSRPTSDPLNKSSSTSSTR